MQPVPEIKQAPRIQKQHNRHADGENARHFERYRHPAVYPLLQFRVITLHLRRQGDGFRDPARQQPRHKGRNANNGQAFERRPHHKFQAIARVKQRKEAQYDEVSACKPVPHQGERANKEAKEGEGAIGQIQQALGNGFFIVEDKVQRPDGNADHDQHVCQRAKLDVHLVGDDRHGNQQAVANQPAEHAQTQRPVLRARIPNGEGTQLRHVRTKE